MNELAGRAGGTVPTRRTSGLPLRSRSRARDRDRHPRRRPGPSPSRHDTTAGSGPELHCGLLIGFDRCDGRGSDVKAGQYSQVPMSTNHDPDHVSVRADLHRIGLDRRR